MPGATADGMIKRGNLPAAVYLHHEGNLLEPDSKANELPTMGGSLTSSVGEFNAWELLRVKMRKPKNVPPKS
jgi:hypothetical protein